MRKFPPGLALAVVFCIWLGLIAGGSCWLIRYSSIAGDVGHAPPVLPPSLVSTSSSTRSRLLLSLHPRCPCSRATLRELARVLTRVPDSCEVTVLMYRPRSESDAWMDGSLLDECRRMRLHVTPDPDGLLAASLGSFTSGGVILYDRQHRLRYQGGITLARGHEGDNGGEDALVHILRGNAAGAFASPVFGCPLRRGRTNLAEL